MSPFDPPFALNNGHIQTVLGSTGRRWLMPRRAAGLISAAERVDITVPCGTTLRAMINTPQQADSQEQVPLVVLIHGWLGCDHSSYVLSAASALHQQGFATARINLRDHGDTESLNEGMYHSGLTQEIVELVEALAARNGDAPAGVLGFSLGGNFALRVARATSLPTMAVCPAVDPARTMHQIDHGSPIYKHYFLGKWRKALDAKQAAFPDLYDFSKAHMLRSVATLTDYFVRYHSEFSSTNVYFDSYDLSGSALENVSATVLMAEDDPVIPKSQFDSLPSGIVVERIKGGGHGSFVDDFGLNSWCDRYAVHWAQNNLTGASAA